jgi:Tfp pilus assembly protein PilZ
MRHPKRRRLERARALNLVDYILIGEDGVQMTRGMGRTRNVSEEGLLLETHRPLRGGQTILITMGIKDHTVRLRGRVVHVELPASFPEERRHCAGVKFTAADKAGAEALKRYIHALKALGGT